VPALLDVRHLTVEFPSQDGVARPTVRRAESLKTVHSGAAGGGPQGGLTEASRSSIRPTLVAVHDLSVTIAPREVLGLVGE